MSEEKLTIVLPSNPKCGDQYIIENNTGENVTITANPQHTRILCDHIIGWDNSSDTFFKNDTPLRQSEYLSWTTTNPVPNPFNHCPDCGEKLKET